MFSQLELPNQSCLYYHKDIFITNNKAILDRIDIYIPGWGMRGDIYFLNNINTPSVILDNCHLRYFYDTLDYILGTFNCSQFVFHGFSMGGGLLLDYFSRHQHVNSLVYLYGMRPCYPNSIIVYLKKNIYF